MKTPGDLITATEARELLQTSPNKIADLIRDGVLKAYTSQLDKRKKLVSRAEVERLKNTFEEAA